LKEVRTIALIGNPNSGKSTLFNALTGLNQKVGNFPGVTVDKKEGSVQWEDQRWRLIDFPGCYSLFPNSSDEKVVIEVLSQPASPLYPDLVVYVADANNLERHLLLATQVLDLGIPMILALNMSDQALSKGMVLNTKGIAEDLSVPVIEISARTGYNLSELKSLIKQELEEPALGERSPFYKIPAEQLPLLGDVQKVTQDQMLYRNKVLAHHHNWLQHLNFEEKKAISEACVQHQFEDVKEQINETMQRYNRFIPIALKGVLKDQKSKRSLSEKVDRLITHRLLGPVIFFTILLFVFQAIYAWATIPMDWIEGAFASISAYLQNNMPDAWFTDLLVNGVIAGIGGVVIFIPQIALLFFLLTLLEEVGYMSRAVLCLMD
jgi:ferrous iron transport protein B